jgi:hypothetical protein
LIKGVGLVTIEWKGIVLFIEFDEPFIIHASLFHDPKHAKAIKEFLMLIREHRQGHGLLTAEISS